MTDTESPSGKVMGNRCRLDDSHSDQSILGYTHSTHAHLLELSRPIREEWEQYVAYESVANSISENLLTQKKYLLPLKIVLIQYYF